jgi:hypothetical protein
VLVSWLPFRGGYLGSLADVAASGPRRFFEVGVSGMTAIRRSTAWEAAVVSSQR